MKSFYISDDAKYSSSDKNKVEEYEKKNGADRAKAKAELDEAKKLYDAAYKACKEAKKKYDALAQQYADKYEYSYTDLWDLIERVFV